jgi:integrase
LKKPPTRKSKYNYEIRPCYTLFLETIKSPDGRVVWANYLHNFMAHQCLKGYDDLLAEPAKAIQARLRSYVIHKKAQGTRGQSIGNHLTALRHFYWINEVEGIAWDRVRALLPEAVKALEDVPYTHEQISAMLKVAKRRLRIPILSEAQGGPRIGAIPILKKGDLAKTSHGFYRVIIYRGTKSAYVTFFGPEATTEIDEYFAYRERCGEVLTDESALIREEFDANTEGAKHPRFVSKRTLERQIAYVAQAAGIRTVEKGGGPSKRKKIMLTHGLRKFFKRQCRRAGVDPVNLEHLQGHKHGDVGAGVTKLMMTYDPADEQELLQEYLKAIDFLTIDSSKRLEKENSVLMQSLSTEMEVKDRQIQDLQKKMEALQVQQEDSERAVKSHLSLIQQLPRAFKFRTNADFSSVQLLPTVGQTHVVADALNAIEALKKWFNPTLEG